MFRQYSTDVDIRDESVKTRLRLDMGSTSQHKMAVTGWPRNSKVNSVVMLYNYFWQNGTFLWFCINMALESVGRPLLFCFCQSSCACLQARVPVCGCAYVCLWAASICHCACAPTWQPAYTLANKASFVCSLLLTVSSTSRRSVTLLLSWHWSMEGNIWYYEQDITAV